MRYCKMIRIGDLFDIEKGSIQSSKCIEGEYPFITASEEWKTHNEYSHECEALIFAMGASGSLGRTHYINGKFVSSDLCFILTPKKEYKDKLNLRFYFYYFNTFREKIVKATATGTSKLAINKKNFSDYKIHFIEIEKQVSLISKIEKTQIFSEALLRQTERQEKYVSFLRQAILQRAVEGKLCKQYETDEPVRVLLEKIRAEKEKLIAEKKIKKQKEMPPITEEIKPFALPQGWEWCRLGELLTKNEYGVSEKADSIRTNSSIPVLRMNNITFNGVMSYTDLKYVSDSIKELPTLLLEKNDLLFNRTNSYELVGKTGLFNENEQYTFASYLIRLRVLFVNSSYIHICMNSKYFRISQIEPYIVQQNGQANYNGTKVASTLIPLPSIAEQQRIVEKVHRLMVLCDELEQEIANAKKYASQLMEAVLQEAFGGRPQSKPNNITEITAIQLPAAKPLMAAARGKMREDTWKRIRNEAVRLASGES